MPSQCSKTTETHGGGKPRGGAHARGSVYEYESCDRLFNTGIADRHEVSIIQDFEGDGYGSDASLADALEYETVVGAQAPAERGVASPILEEHLYFKHVS